MQEVKVYFSAFDGTQIGEVDIIFIYAQTQNTWYRLPFCNQIDKFEFSTALPSTPEKIWRITLEKIQGTTLIIHCNEVEVAYVPMSSCTTAHKDVLNRETAYIKFATADDGSLLYREAPFPGKYISNISNIINISV